MPPDPILALLSFVGLLTYSAIGGVVGTAAVRLFGTKEKSRNYEYGPHRHLRAIAGAENADDDGWIGFGFAAVLWPLALAASLVGGTAFALGFGPYWLIRKIGRYTASALLPKEPADVA